MGTSRIGTVWNWLKNGAFHVANLPYQFMEATPYLLDTVSLNLNGVSSIFQSLADSLAPPSHPEMADENESPPRNWHYYPRHTTATVLKATASSFYFGSKTLKVIPYLPMGVKHLYSHLGDFIRNPAIATYEGLSSREPVIEPIPFYSSLAEQTELLQASIDNTLQKVVDAEEYERITACKLELLENNPDYLPDPEKDPLYYYSNLHLLSLQLKESLPYLGQALTDLGRALDENADLETRTLAVFNLTALIKPLNKTFFNGAKATFERLRITAFPFRIPEFDDYYKAMDTLLPLTEFMGRINSSKRIQMLIKNLSEAETPSEEKPSTPPQTALQRLFSRTGLAAPADVPALQRDATATITKEPHPAIMPDDINAIETQADIVASLAKLLSSQLEKIEDSNITPTAKKDIQQAMNALVSLKGIFTDYNTISRSKQEFAYYLRQKLDLVSLLLSCIPDMLKLQGHGSQAYNSLSSTFHDDYLNLLHQINLLFKETCLRIDAIELQCFLKEGHLLKLSASGDGPSLYTLMEKFSAIIGQETGFHNLYAFDENEQFPYTHAINEQRTRLLATAEKEVKTADDALKSHEEQQIDPAKRNTSYRKHLDAQTCKKAFIAKRQSASAKDLETLLAKNRKTQELNKLDYLFRRNQKIRSVLDSKITLLDREMDFIYSNTKAKKIRLLTELRKHLVHQSQTLTEALMLLKSELPNDFHLLWEGRTRAIMQEVEGICFLRKDCITRINLDIHRLEAKRQHPILLYPGSKSNILEKRIAALKLLRDLQETPGYRPSYALEKLKARNPGLHQILEKHDYATIRAMKRIEKTIRTHFEEKIPETLFGKIIIGHQKTRPSIPGIPPAQEQIKQIKARIAELEREKLTFFGAFSRSVKDRKIALLTLIKNKIEKSRYALCQLTEGLLPVPGKLYLAHDASQNDILNYTVINPAGEVCHGSLKSRDLPSLNRKTLPSLTAGEQGELLSEILTLTAKRGHTSDKANISLQTALQEITDHRKYKLCLKSDDTLPEPGKLYVACDPEKENTLNYTVIGRFGEVNHGTLTAHDIPALMITPPLKNTGSVEKHLPAILKLTTERGHTYESNVRATLHHLHQGRTGKLMKQLYGETLTPDEIITRIGLEIERLHKARITPLWFREASRKKSLEAHIAALTTLKQRIATGDYASSHAAIASLDQDDQQQLVRHSSALLQTLGIKLPLSRTPEIQSRPESQPIPAFFEIPAPSANTPPEDTPEDESHIPDQKLANTGWAHYPRRAGSAVLKAAPYAPQMIKHIYHHFSDFISNPIKATYDGLTSREPVMEDIPLYKGLARHTGLLQSTIDSTLQKVLDADEYRKIAAYKVELLKNETDYLPDPKEDPLYYYSNLHLLSLQLKEALPFIGQALTDLGRALDENEDLETRAHALLNLIALIKPLNEKFFNGAKPTYERLRFTDLPFRIPEFEDYYKAMDALLPVAEFMERFNSSNRVQTLIKNLVEVENNPLEDPSAPRQNPLQRFLTVTGLTRPGADLRLNRAAADLRENIHPAHDNTAGHPVEDNADILTSLAKLLNNQLEKIDDSSITPAAKKDIEAAMAALVSLKRAFTDYNKISRNKQDIAYFLLQKLDLISFVISSIPDMLKLQGHGWQAYNSLSSTFHDDYLNILHQINLLFKETCLRLDAIELQSFLKEGYLLKLSPSENGPSLYALMEKFFAVISQETGFHNLYSFDEKEQFPYTHAINEQRIRMLADAEKKEQATRAALDSPETSPAQKAAVLKKLAAETYQKEFIAKRQTASDKDLKAIQAQNNHSRREREIDYLFRRNEKIRLVLDSHLAKLNKEMETSHSRVKAKKLRLLTELRQTLVIQNNPLDEALVLLKSSLKDDFHLLWEGRTRTLLQQIEGACLLPKDCVIRVNLAIHRLEEKRQSKILFAPSSGSDTLERRIAALKYLRDLLETPGYCPSYALDKFKARNPLLHESLVKHDHATIREIERIEETIDRNFSGKISRNFFGKILIGYQKPKPPVRGVLPVREQMEKIETRIAELEREKLTFSGFFSRSVKEQKIALLTLLKDKIEKSGISLQTALQEITDHRKYKLSLKDDKTVLEPRKLYVEYDPGKEDTLCYTVIGPFGEANTSTLTTHDIPSLTAGLTTPLNVSHLEKHLPAILKLTAGRGHTYESNVRATLHHLYQGRSGKLLKQLSGETFTQEEILAKISLEIERLRMERPTLLFFPPVTHRKMELEQHLSALDDLKQAIVTGRFATSQDAIVTLSLMNQSLLERHSSDLLEELGVQLPLPKNPPAETFQLSL